MARNLHTAAKDGDLQEVRDMLAKGNDVNGRDKLSRTPIHLAAWAGQDECLKVLIAAKANVSDAAVDDMNALHFAASKGHLETCRILLNAGVSIHSKTRKGMTALHFAAQNGNTGLVSLLVKRRADPMAETQKQKKPLDLARDAGVRILLDQAMADAQAKKAERQAGQKERSHVRKREERSNAIGPVDAGPGSEHKPAKAARVTLAHLGDEEEEQECS